VLSFCEVLVMPGRVGPRVSFGVSACVCCAVGFVRSFAAEPARRKQSWGGRSSARSRGPWQVSQRGVAMRRGQRRLQAPQAVLCSRVQVVRPAPCGFVCVSVSIRFDSYLWRARSLKTRGSDGLCAWSTDTWGTDGLCAWGTDTRGTEGLCAWGY
jgi:hypothetical protein